MVVMEATQPLGAPRVYVHDSFGARMGEITTRSSVNRSWPLMQPSQGMFRCALDDPLIRDYGLDVIKPHRGRLVVIESDDYPVPWAGGIMSRERDTASGEHTVTLQSVDALLSQRPLSTSAHYSKSAGACFRQIIDDANAENDSGITVGAVADGPVYTTTPSDRMAYAALNALCQQAGFEWWVDATADEHAVTARARFAPARGEDAFSNDVLLYEGGNCDVLSDKEDMRGALFAARYVGGLDSALQAYTERPRVNRQTSGAPMRQGSVVGASATIHGYEIEQSDLGTSPITRREGIVQVDNLLEAGAISVASEIMLGKPRGAERSLRVRVWSGFRELWALCTVGSIVHLVSDAAFGGFDGPVRLVSVQPSEEAGDLILACQVLRPRVV